MSAPVPDFCVGDELQLDLTFTNPDGSAMDISGHLLILAVKGDLAVDDTQAYLLLKQTAPSGAPSTNGQISLVMTSALTGKIPPGQQYLAVRKVSGSSPVHPWTFVNQTVNVSQGAVQGTS